MHGYCNETLPSSNLYNKHKVIYPRGGWASAVPRCLITSNKNVFYKLCLKLFFVVNIHPYTIKKTWMSFLHLPSLFFKQFLFLLKGNNKTSDEIPWQSRDNEMTYFWCDNGICSTAWRWIWAIMWASWCFSIGCLIWRWGFYVADILLETKEDNFFTQSRV